ncbi:thiol-disulfide oxidoreductase DCC family protein [Marisediminicola sp. LYQ134]|uniref:thiol-disulfide oxidoreductase DCC family protein n=1 Tax=Marisediminicola sp. LYQ134 TaxID=3391061 RepID=UPI0039838A1F
MPTLLYDGDCAFCTATARRLHARGGFDIRAWQSVDDLARWGLTHEEVSNAAHWIDDDGVVHGGPDAIAHAMVARGGAARVAGRLIVKQPVRFFAQIVYRWVAKNRHRLPG